MRMPITILYGKQDDGSALVFSVSSEVPGTVASVPVESFGSIAMSPDGFWVFGEDWSLPIPFSCPVDSWMRAAPHSAIKHNTKLIKFFISINDDVNVTTMFPVQKLFHNWTQNKRSQDFMFIFKRRTILAGSVLTQLQFEHYARTDRPTKIHVK